jgi:glycosyltransferase involved in cell wall biosynthesis
MGDRDLKRFEQNKNVHGSVIKVYRVGSLGKYDKFTYPFKAYRKALDIHKKKKFDICYSVMANHAGLAASWFSKKTKVPFVLNLQMGQSDKDIRKKLGPLFGIYKKIYLSADRVHAISNFLAKRAERFGVEKDKISVIPNGVDLTLFDRKRFTKRQIEETKKLIGIPKDKKIIISASRLSRKNGLEYAIRAMKEIEGVLLLIGEGELEDELKQIAKREKVSEKVIFYGRVEHSELPKFLCISDVFVRPSLSEGQGISFIEAMACRVPVVATSVGGISDFLEDEKTGYVCRVKSPKSVAGKIRLAMKNHSKNKKIVDDAYKLVGRRYGWNRIMDEINQLYGEL